MLVLMICDFFTRYVFLWCPFGRLCFPHRLISFPAFLLSTLFPEMQTRYKKEAGSVCGFSKFITSGSSLSSRFSKFITSGSGLSSRFSKFITSGSGLSSRFSKFQIRVWVRVQNRVQDCLHLCVFSTILKLKEENVPHPTAKKSLNKNRIYKLHYVI